jgi:Flp pilus assembly protein TadD
MFDRRQAIPLTKRGWVFLEDNIELAIRDFQTAKEHSPDNPDTLIGLASAYAKSGNRQAAIREVDMACPLARIQAAEVGPTAFALFHNAATVHARLGESVLRDPRLTTELRRQQFTESATRAVDLLREAFDIAKSDATVAQAMLTAMQTDEALRSIRGSKAYGKFIEELSKELSGGTSK